MPDTANGSFDDILGSLPSTEEKNAVADLADGGVPAESPEQARIRALEEQLAQLRAQTAASVGPIADVEKTPAQKAQEHVAAIQATRAVLSSETSFQEATDDDIVFHVLVNGLTIAGAVRHPGETVRIKRNSQAYDLGADRTGYNWLDDLSDEGQIRHFGRVVLGVGPFEGKTPDDDLSRAEAARAATAVTRVL